MRIEPYSVGSYVHVIKRGARGLHITQDKADQWRFVRLLYYANDSFSNEYWERETSGQGLFFRPNTWPKRTPIVKILAWTLMPNHFHLLLKEIQTGGVSKFLQRLCGSMTTSFNHKYGQLGSIFQGSYKSRTVENDVYIRYLASYIMVKNVFELFPGGYDQAKTHFDDAWNWTAAYSFSSFPDYLDKRRSPIIEKDILGDIFSNPKDFYDFSKDMIAGRIHEKNERLLCD